MKHNVFGIFLVKYLKYLKNLKTMSNFRAKNDFQTQAASIKNPALYLQSFMVLSAYWRYVLIVNF